MQPNTQKRVAGFTTTMCCPAGMTSLSIGGVEVFPDESGMIDVPNASVKEMLSHGLTLGRAEAEQEQEQEPPKKKLTFGSKKTTKKQ